MSELEKASDALRRMAICEDRTRRVDPRVAIAVSLVYLVVMLSVGVGHLSALLWFALYPIISSALLGLQFSRIFRKSLVVLPLVALIGIFNPWLDLTPAFKIGSIIISEGWISFISIVLRGLLAMQCVLILIESEGFIGLCRGLHRLGIPRFLTDQLQFVYRYIAVLINEASIMKRAREARGFGRRRMPLKMWSTMIGQLFLRTIDRSERIHNAMLARGFNGSLPDFYSSPLSLKIADWIYLIVWISLFLVFRFAPLSSLFVR